MKRSLIAVGAMGLLLTLASCSQNASKENKTATTVKESNTATEPTKQHIIILTVKDEYWNEYLDAMHNNIAKTRLEEGSIIFQLLQPEDGTHRVALIERFKSKAAFDEHFKADYIPKALMGKAKIGEANWIDLKEVAQVPPIEPKDPFDVISPRNVLVFFDVKPEKRKAFIDAAAELMPQSRKAPGNIRFNLFEQEKDQNKFVFVESWENAATHETQLEQDFIKKFFKDTDGMFISDPLETRWFAKDISK